jgi:hypothetical protein
MREKPWFRSQTKHWYVEIGGKQHKLCPGESKEDRASEKKAKAEWHALAARLDREPEQKPKASGSVKTSWLANEFLAHTNLHCEPDTYFYCN